MIAGSMKTKHYTTMETLTLKPLNRPSEPMPEERQPVYTVLSIMQLEEMIQAIKDNRPGESGNQLTSTFVSTITGKTNYLGQTQISSNFEIKKKVS